MIRVDSSKQHLFNSRPLEGSRHHWSIPTRLVYFLLEWLPQGLLEFLTVFLSESDTTGLFLKIFPESIHWSVGAAADLLVHILEWLCRLFPREPKFNGCLFILSLDNKIEYQNGKIRCSESSNEAVLCHYYWRKTGTLGSQEQQKQLPTVIKLEEVFWKIVF